MNDDLIYMFIVVMGSILLFALISNVLVIVSVTRFRKLRSVTNVLISNLAVSDILLAGLYMPQKLHDLSHTADYREGVITCKLIHATPVVLITSSCYTLVFVSFERYRAIAVSHKPQMTLTQICKVIPLLWIFSFFVSIPTSFEYSIEAYNVYSENNKTRIHLSCGNNKMSSGFVLTNGMSVLIISFVIPLVLVFCNYIRLAIFINRRGRQIFSRNTPGSVATVDGQLNNHSVSHLHKNRFRLVKMLVLVAVMFAVSWVPFFILFVYMKITGKDASKDAGSAVGLLLDAMATFSTAYNAVLYIIFNKNFREAFSNILRCMWK